MSFRDYLLEVGTEEIPARFIPNIITAIRDSVSDWLKQQALAHADLKVYATPRRLVVIIKQLAEKQQDQEKEVRGPSVNVAFDNDKKLTKAGQGFVRSQQATEDDIEIRENEQGSYMYVVKKLKGQVTTLLLPELSDIILKLPFPKTMRWGHSEVRFVRPVQWLISLYGSEVVDMELAGQKASNTSRGHRFLGSSAIKITSATDYLQLLKQEYVTVDQDERRLNILEEIKKLEQVNNVKVLVDENLLEEVIYLVEHATAVFGSFDPDFMQVPREVLITSMKEHQRYFPVEDSEGQLLAHFVTIRNGDDFNLETVRKGNEKVLRARLADARFFYDEDKKITIDTFLAKLAKVVYHKELGTIMDKVSRIATVQEKIISKMTLDISDINYTKRAVEICKFDLASGMVYEFPELQGIMGQEYASLSGEESVVAKAIFEHYLPRFAGDVLPTTDVGAILSIADKMDTIVSCFGVGIVPTGSQDPYGLRRQTAGICQIVVDRNYQLDLAEIIKETLENNDKLSLLKKDKDKLFADIVDFFKQRIKKLLLEKGHSFENVEAVTTTDKLDIYQILSQATAIQELIIDANNNLLIDAFNRMYKISAKADAAIMFAPDYLIEASEQKLASNFLQLEQPLIDAISNKDYSKAIKFCDQLVPDINEFFDNIMVMHTDIKLRNNRLALIKRIVALWQIIGDLSKINLK